jgi:hypothetical protein
LMELENIILNDVSQAQKAKSPMFSLIWGIWPNANAAILWDTGDTKGRSCMGVVG